MGGEGGITVGSLVRLELCFFGGREDEKQPFFIASLECGCKRGGDGLAHKVLDLRRDAQARLSIIIVA